MDTKLFARAKIKLFLPSIIIAVMVTLLATVIIHSAGIHLWVWIVWLVIAVLLILFLCYAYARASAVNAKRKANLAHIIAQIASGSESLSDEDYTLLDEFDTDLVNAVKGLSESVSVLRREKCQRVIVIESMADGVITVDVHGRIMLCNSAACRLCDVSNLRIGMQLEDSDVHPEIIKLSYECMSEKNVLTSEIRLPGWPQRVIGIRAAWYRQANSSEDCALIMLHDLTDVRRHEMNQREFVANVSHELKTPITAVRTSAEALLAGAKNDEDFVDRFLNSIIAESDRLSLLIEDLLDIARRDSGITQTQKTTCSLVEIISRAVRVINPQAVNKNISIEVKVPDDLAGYCDEAQTVQMVRNLVDNAVKYTADGGHVSVEANEHESGFEIMVTDTGIGIPQGELDRIFERFYRVDKARSRRLGGTGLGLAIVKDIADSHGGKIDVRTQLGKGSSFTVTFPGASGE
ncbi:ATP-binding protein [bacterium]|nr:ATP-binding protein [bacterium]